MPAENVGQFKYTTDDNRQSTDEGADGHTGRAFQWEASWQTAQKVSGKASGKASWKAGRKVGRKAG